MSGEGGAGKIGFASGHSEGSSFEGAPHPVRPGFALRLSEPVPPLQGRFRLGFRCKQGRSVVGALLAAAYGAMAFILSDGICNVVRVFPAPRQA